MTDDNAPRRMTPALQSALDAIPAADRRAVAIALELSDTPIIGAVMRALAGELRAANLPDADVRRYREAVARRCTTGGTS